MLGNYMITNARSIKIGKSSLEQYEQDKDVHEIERKKMEIEKNENEKCMLSIIDQPWISSMG